MQEARLEARDRDHNYAAAWVEGIDEPVIGVSKKGRHAEGHIRQQIGEDAVIKSIYSEFEPCEGRRYQCGPDLLDRGVEDITYSWQWNPPEVRDASKAAKKAAVRELFQ